MKFCCPGSLYAKSLLVGGELSKDYEEWFSHPEIQAQNQIVNCFKLDLNLDAEPVLASVELDRDCYVVIRCSWSATGDRHGRRHSRRETCIVNSQQLQAMLSGHFTAVPNKDTMTFAVETDGGEPLAVIRSEIIRGCALKVYAQGNRDFNLEKRDSAEGPIHTEQPTPASDKSTARLKLEGEETSSQNKQVCRESTMFKILSVIFACCCLVAGWFCYSVQSENKKLREDMNIIQNEKDSLQNEKDSLQNEKDALQKEKVELEQQLKDRKDFERNVKKFNDGMPRFTAALEKLEKFAAEEECAVKKTKDSEAVGATGQQGKEPKKTENKGYFPW